MKCAICGKKVGVASGGTLYHLDSHNDRPDCAAPGSCRGGPMTNLVACNRCGQQKLAWVQSKRTGRYYLAHTQAYHGMHHGNGYSRGGTNVLAHRPHKCDEDRPVCDICGYRHSLAGELADCQWRQGGGRIVEDGHELLYRGEAPKVSHDEELPRVLIEQWKKGKK